MCGAGCDAYASATSNFASHKMLKQMNTSAISGWNRRVTWGSSGFWRPLQRPKRELARHRQSKEVSILWSHHEETRERDNARDNARCTQARKTTHGLDGQHQIRGQDSPWKSQSEWQKTETNWESTSMVWPIIGSRKNWTEQLSDCRSQIDDKLHTTYTGRISINK